ncbi:MAG: methyl-accepting chemotaxis protein, partial [Burkholderiaceae bacterium]
VTQQNAALVEEAAAAAASMQNQASHLSQTVSVFKLGNDVMVTHALQPKLPAVTNRSLTSVAKPVQKAITNKTTNSKIAAPKPLRTGTDNTDWEEF